MRLARAISFVGVFAPFYAIAYFPRMIEASQIRDFIASSGMKQHQLAKQVGVTQPTVSRWLNKGQAPEAAHQDKLAELFAKHGKTIPTPPSPGALAEPATDTLPTCTYRSQTPDEERLVRFGELVADYILLGSQVTVPKEEISARIELAIRYLLMSEGVSVREKTIPSQILPAVEGRTKRQGGAL